MNPELEQINKDFDTLAAENKALEDKLQEYRSGKYFYDAATIILMIAGLAALISLPPIPAVSIIVGSVVAMAVLRHWRLRQVKKIEPCVWRKGAHPRPRRPHS